MINAEDCGGRGLRPFGGGKVPRRPADLYPTEPPAVEAFLRVEAGRMLAWDSAVFEPACGPGMVAKVLEARGFLVHATDLHHHGYGVPGCDFLDCAAAPCRVLVTNPPFGELAEAFARHAVITLGVPYVALLLKSTYFHADCRRALYLSHPPSMVYPLGWRLNWDLRGSPVEEHSWFVWDAARRWRDGCARYAPALPRPQSCPEVGYGDWLRAARLAAGLAGAEDGS